jgi:hypothetical protein
MPKASEISNEKGTFLFFCPGCKCGHVFRVPPWTFNGDTEKPTVGGSVLVYPHKSTPPFRDTLRCHSFITDGKIQFLADCEHELKNQTVDLPDLLGKTDDEIGNVEPEKQP